MDRTSYSKFAFIALATALSACASTSRPQAAAPAGPAHHHIGPKRLSPEQQELRRAEAERRAAAELRSMRQGQINAAYDQGVNDTLEEFRGRMHGRSSFVFEPPVIEWVDMPAQVVNGALVPAHRAQVMVTPGRWVEHNGVPVPTGASSDPIVESVAPTAEMAAGSRIEYVND